MDGMRCVVRGGLAWLLAVSLSGCGLVTVPGSDADPGDAVVVPGDVPDADAPGPDLVDSGADADADPWAPEADAADQGTDADAALAADDADGAGAPDVLVDGTSTEADTDAQVPRDAQDAASPVPDAEAGPVAESGPDAPVADTCATATLLAGGVALTSESFTRGGVAPTGCGSTTGPTRYYALTLAAGTRITVTATPGVTSQDVSLRILGGCDTGVCLGAAETPQAGAIETLVFTNAQPVERRVVLAVTGVGVTGGTFRLSVSVASAYAPYSCSSAALLSSGATYTNVSLTDVRISTTVCEPSVTRGMLFYRVSVPAGHKLSVRAGTSTTFASGATIRLFPDCNLAACLASGQDEVSWTNTDSAAREIRLGVTSTDGTPTSITLRAVTAPPATETTCTAAMAVTSGTTVQVQNPLDGGASLVSCDGSASRPRYYAIRVPVGSVLRVYSTTASVQPEIRVLNGCGATSCLTPLARGSLTWSNGTAAPVDAIVVVSPQTSQLTAAFSVAFRVDSMPTDAVCASATPLALPALVSGLSFAGGSDGPPPCFAERSLVRYFRVTVPAQRQLDARLALASGTGGTLSLRVLDSCGGTQCLAGTLVAGSAVNTRYVNTGSMPREVILAAGLDLTGSALGTYDLTVSEGPIQDGLTCATAFAFSPGTVTTPPLTVTGRETATNCTGTSVASLFYRVTVPAGRRATVTHTSWDYPTLRFLTGCGATTCVAVAGGSSSASSIRYTNAGAVDQTVILAISPYYSSSTGAITMTLAIDTPPAESSCQTAPLLTDGATRSGSLSDASGLAPNCTSSTMVQALFFRVAVPPSQTLLVTETTGSAVRILDTCTSVTCAAAQEYSGSGATSSTTRWSNTGTVAREVLIAVSAYYYSSTYSLRVDLRPFVAAGACATAPVLSSAAPLTAQAFADARTTATDCSSGTPSTMFYSVSVPAGQRALARATAASGWANLRFLAGCGAATCLGTRGTSTAAGWARYANTSSVSQTVILAVSGSAAATFDLSVEVAATPTYANCTTAPLVGAGTVRALSFIESAASAPTCGYYSGSGPAQFHAVDVPPGQRLQASTNHVDAAVRFLSACGGACSGSSYVETGGYGAAYVNTSGTTQRMLVASGYDDPYYSPPDARYDLTFTLDTPPAHSQCTTAPLLATGTTVAGLTRSDLGASAATCSSTPAPAVFHSIEIPAGYRLEATGSGGSSSYPPFVRILAACNAATCLGTASNSTYGTPARYANTSSSAQTVFIASAPPSTSSAYPAWSVTPTLYPIAANAQCSGARTLSDGALVPGERTADAVGPSATCNYVSGPALWYTAVVPAGQQLTVTASVPSSYYAPALQVIGGCGAATCLAYSTSSYSATSTVSYRNSSGSSQSVWIAAVPSTSSYSAAQAFDLAASIRP